MAIIMMDLGNGPVGIWYESYKRGIVTAKTRGGIKLVLKYYNNYSGNRDCMKHVSLIK
jgi:hypothetical protein